VCVCVYVRGVVLCRCLRVCDLLIFLQDTTIEFRHLHERSVPCVCVYVCQCVCVRLCLSMSVCVCVVCVLARPLSLCVVSHTAHRLHARFFCFCDLISLVQGKTIEFRQLHERSVRMLRKASALTERIDYSQEVVPGA